MSKIHVLVKKSLERNSNRLSILRYVPFSIRLGKIYRDHVRLIAWYANASEKARRSFHYDRLNKILDYSYHNIPFYEEFYSSKNYNPKDFKRLEDFLDVPIINKNTLKQYTLDQRSIMLPGATLSNTGGTTGNPLDFRLDKHCFHREWAYMHNIWANLGYNYLDTKLTFRGMNIGTTPLRYNVVHNEYIVNAYLDLDLILDAISKLAVNKKIKYLHGYPSSIYEFCKYMQAKNLSSEDVFQGHLNGVLFGSEFPAPQYRSLIEKVLKVPTLSWYGHSEFAILAQETRPFLYSPLQTYGFAEAVNLSKEEEVSLVGTGYYNKASPFIRYDTGDLIKSARVNGGILEGFEISAGRVGDFIVDANGTRISLTALIFGRHHIAFSKADFIQVRSVVAGKATLVVTGANVKIEDFDLSDVSIDFELEIVEKPFKTTAGKLPLLII